MTGRILATLAASGLGLGCGAEEAAPDNGSAKEPASRAVAAACLPTGDGYLRIGLSGSLTADVAWPNSGTTCDGMARPDGSGARVTFSRSIYEDGNRLTLVFGIDGIEEGETGTGFPVNVTLIREGLGQFYGTLGGASCDVDVETHSAMDTAAARVRPYSIEASGRCHEPVPAVAGDGEVNVGDFHYKGVVVWEDSPDAQAD